MQTVNLKLQGQFKFDLYRQNGELIKSSEYIDNFITNSGVVFPYHFAFADCFRYLSIGTSNAQNSIVTPETTGLTQPVPLFQYVGGRPGFTSGTDSSYYAQPGNFGGGCGFVNTPSGVSLVRQWNLPNNTGGTFSAPQTFREFMVSPGRPYVTGLNGNNSKFCSCFEFDAAATGLDNSSTSAYYNWVAQKYLTLNAGSKKLKTCDATGAFARVLHDFTVETDSILTVSYKLDVIIETGIAFASLSYQRPPSDLDPNWNHKLNAYGSITNPGVMLINDGTILSVVAPNNNQRLQHFDYSNGATFYDFSKEYGESFVPPMGAPLEPSHFFLQNQGFGINQNVVAYLSNDNLQFLVNKNGGKFTDTGNYAPWNFWRDEWDSRTFSFGEIVATGSTSYRYIFNEPTSGNLVTNPTYWEDLGHLKEIHAFSSGAMPFRNDNDAALIGAASYWSSNTSSYNIRRTSGKYPSPTNVTQELAMAARHFQATKVSMPTFLYTAGARDAKVVYTYSFEQFSQGQPMLAKSLVVGYKDLEYGTAAVGCDTKNIMPFFDAVFSGVSGNTSGFFIPTIETGIFNSATGAGIAGADYTEFNSLISQSQSVYPIIKTSLSWSVPCPQGVNGC